MKQLLAYSTLAVLILLSAPERSYGQAASQNIFPDRMVTEKKLAAEQIDVTQRIISRGNYFAMIGPDASGDRSKGDNTLQVLNMSGDLLWKKAGLPHIDKVSIEENSGNLLAVYNYEVGDIGRNAYFSSAGEVLWDIPVQAPGITIGPKGYYGIVRTTGGEDDGGKFRIFDMASGQQLENNPLNSIDYQYFRAAFIDEYRVAIFYQNIVLKPIVSEQLRAIKLRKEGKLKFPVSIAEGRPSDSRPNYISEKVYPVQYMLYSIATEEVITHKELVSGVGGSYELTGIPKNNIAIANDFGSIMLELRNGSLSRDATQIVALGIDGSLLWESPELPEGSISSLNILTTDDILVDAQPALTHRVKGFILLNGSTGNVKWRSDVKKINSSDSRPGLIEKIFEMDGEIIIQTTNGMHANKLFSLSKIDGTQRHITETKEYLLKANQDNGDIVTFDRTQKLLKTYE